MYVLASQIYKLKTQKVNRRYVKMYVYFYIISWNKVSVNRAEQKVKKIHLKYKKKQMPFVIDIDVEQV